MSAGKGQERGRGDVWAMRQTEGKTFLAGEVANTKALGWESAVQQTVCLQSKEKEQRKTHGVLLGLRSR